MREPGAKDEEPVLHSYDGPSASPLGDTPLQTGRTCAAPLIRTLLICHEDALLDREVLTRWLASFSDLVGVVILQETSQRMRVRVRREVKRVGVGRFLDV